MKKSMKKVRKFSGYGQRRADLERYLGLWPSLNQPSTRLFPTETANAMDATWRFETMKKSMKRARSETNEKFYLP